MPDALKNPINALADVSSGAEGPNFCLSLHLYSYLRMRAANALASLRISAGSPELSLFNNAIRTDASCTGSIFS